ncbi:uracil-DNA glycosylase [Sphingomonas sp. PB2P19]|uniref:uracil-DNA glycosylase n=1 Tax=Sphingomonas rhamnosi TaxID=3096156 RepID=UPI002FCC2D30
MTDALSAHWHPSWAPVLAAERDRPAIAALERQIAADEAAGARIFPPAADRFAAFALTPLDQVRVVILGQDPYHSEGQAHGLSFSVRPGVAVPRSLANIYAEMETDLGVPRARHGFLEHWARQGVLLLNAVLSVPIGQANAHRGRGWEAFTDAAIRAVDAQPQPVVFILWGAHAQAKAALVHAPHLVIASPHPSPLSARRGFFGSRPFSRANAFLVDHGRAPIDWALPDLSESEAA